MSLFKTAFGGPPSAPDPNQTIYTANQVANSQQNLNTQAAIGNLQSQTGGQDTGQGWNLSYQQVGTGANGVPIYKAVQTADPTMQGLIDQFYASKGTAGGQAGALLSGANYGASSPTDAIGNMSNGIMGDLMSKWYQSQQPFRTQERNQELARLANQGFGPGTAPWENAMRAVDTSQANALAGAATQFEPQAFNQATQMYQMPMQMAESLGNYGSPVGPTWVDSLKSNISPADLTSAYSTAGTQAQQSYLDKYQQYSDAWKSIGQMGSAALGAFTGMPMLGAGLAGALNGGNMLAATGGAAAPYATNSGWLSSIFNNNPLGKY